MPIEITDQNNKEVAWLCNDVWELTAQMSALESWLSSDGLNLEKGKYSADIGFSPRPGAVGGGCLLSTKSMQTMLNIGMELYLSEYPEFVDEKP